MLLNVPDRVFYVASMLSRSTDQNQFKLMLFN